MNCCSEHYTKYEGKAVEDIPELSDKLVETATDIKNWITTFKCSQCDQVWLEKYTRQEHGDVADVQKWQ